MRENFKSAFSWLVSRAGGALTAEMEAVRVADLIRSLRPIDPGVELIRLGPDGDGGYLVPNDLAGIRACFSPGVSSVSGFEKDCAELGMKVFLADHSVDGPADTHECFFFTKKFVGATTANEFLTMDAWVGSEWPNVEDDLILQMDIEGYEYESILATPEDLMRRFRVIVMEFHSLELLWSSPFFQLAAPTFRKILSTHACVHIHPNNCRPPVKRRGLEIPPVMEFTFLRRDRFIDSKPARTFPHSLDSDNTTRPGYALPGCWWNFA